MASQFTGLCIGGPYAGQMRAHHSPTFRVAEYKPARMSEYGDSLTIDRQVSSVEYRHVIGLRTPDTAFDFWLTPDVLDVSRALNILANGYAVAMDCERKYRERFDG